MTTSFERWRAADLAWIQDNQELVEIAFKWFCQEGEWPRTDALKRHLFQSSVSSLDPQVAADARPGIPGQLHMAHQERLVLGSRHVLGLPSARPLLDLIVAATLEAVEAYRGTAEDPMVNYDNPRFFGFDSETVILMPRFVLDFDHPDAFSGGNPSETWSLHVDAGLVTRFAGITSPEDYVDRQLEIIKEWSDAQDAMTSTARVGPMVSFVVMPFGESWSDDVFSFITRAVERLGGQLNAIRADQITRLGRITDQIMESIRTADVIIADITGNNANVFWELGYAYAYDKPCALLLRSGETAPFDIYDHRRIDYQDPPTEGDELRLSEILARTLGLEDS
jgi:hypothetical protein